MPINKVLILYLQAGGGHKSNAIALKNTLQSYKPELEVELFDFGLKGPIKETSYTWLTEKAKPLWHAISILGKNKLIIRLCNFLFQIFYKKIIKKKALEFQPDLVLNTYYFSASTINNLLPLLPNLSPNHNITAVTDTWSAPSIWFSNPSLQYLVFSDNAFERGINCDIKSANLIKANYFFDSKFNQEMSTEEINQFLSSKKLQTNLDNIVILGGGGSMPDGDKIFLELVKKLESSNQSEQNPQKLFQIICICGRNQTLYNLCLEIKNKLPEKLQKLILIEGFTTQVYEYLNSAKIVISKAGPASILEITALKKPIIISSYIWEQELANKDFVIGNQIGIYEINPNLIATQTIEIINNQSKYQAFKNKLNALNIQSNNQQIASLCLTLP